MPSLEQRDYYERRALEVRALAKATVDPDIRSALEAMAVSYDNLVEEADRIVQMRTRLPQPPRSLDWSTKKSPAG